MIEGAAIATQDVLQTVDPADVTAGGIGFVVIASLAVGTAILLRSMNKQLKKVDFEGGSTVALANQPLWMVFGGCSRRDTKLTPSF